MAIQSEFQQELSTVLRTAGYRAEINAADINVPLVTVLLLLLITIIGIVVLTFFLPEILGRDIHRLD